MRRFEPFYGMIPRSADFDQGYLLPSLPGSEMVESKKVAEAAGGGDWGGRRGD